MLVLPLFVRHAVTLLQIATGTKRLRAGTRENDTTLFVRRGAKPVERRQQVETHLGVHRVRHLGPVQRDQNDVFSRCFYLERFEVTHSIACMISLMNVSMAVGSSQRITATRS